MQPLALTFEDATFRYAQVSRVGMIAIYTQTHKAGRAVRHEVVLVQQWEAHTWPNGTTTPAHEGYPGASTWGREGFTCFGLSEAQAKAHQLARADEVSL